MVRRLQHDHILKDIFKGAANTVIAQPTCPLYTVYQRLVDSGTKPSVARVTPARTIAATVLRMWKNEEPFKSQYYRTSTRTARQA